MWVTKKNWTVFVIKRRLQEAKLERDFIKRYIAACKDSLQNSEIDLLSPRPSCSIEGTVHYSYDYTQQVQIPSNPKQPGPIFFKFLWSEACLRYVVRECRDRSMTSLTRQFLLAKGPMQPLAVCMTSSFLTGQGKLMQCSIEGTVHYSYDYTQQVQIPSNPKQPGPIFFKFLWSEACLRYVVRECRDRSMTSLTRQFLLAKGPMQPLAVCMTSSFLTGQGKLMHKLMQIIMRGTEDKQLFYLVLLLANSLWTAQIIIVFGSDYRAYKI